VIGNGRGALVRRSVESQARRSRGSSVGAIYSEEQVPDGATKTGYNSADPNRGHDHTFFIQLSRDVFAD
jgi:hypothetical protein